MGIAYQEKMNLSLPIFVIFLGRAGSSRVFFFFACTVLSHGSCWLGAVNYGQIHKKMKL
jgi:hypothetical protein